jgi:DNA polymerase-3 subunit delta
LKIPLRQLDRHLADGVASAYLVAGDEPLLVDEALEQIRTAAQKRGFDTRELHSAERNYRWDDLTAGADNLSLFAMRKIVEIRLATPKPGDDGSKAIASLVERRDPDTLLLVAVGAKIDSSASRTAWVKAFEEHGVIVEIWPIDRGDLPRWVQQRASTARLKLTVSAAQALAERVEGNLLAADQEIKRLALTAAGREVDEAEVLEFVANNSRFDIFGLADAVLAGDAPRAFKILSGLRAEGIHPVQIAWALNRDISLLSQLEFAARHGQSVDDALFKARVWQRRHPLVKAALRRFPTRRLRSLVAHAARVDAGLKGVFPAEPWTTLTDLLISLLRVPAGARAR